MGTRDLADLLATNSDNSTHGRFPSGTTDTCGRPWQAVRVVAVDRSEIREAVTLRGQPRVDLGQQGFHVAWSFADLAIPVHAGAEAAGRIAAFVLTREPPCQAVRACIVWIGARRFLVEYAGGWSGGPPSAVCEATPAA